MGPESFSECKGCRRSELTYKSFSRGARNFLMSARIDGDPATIPVVLSANCLHGRAVRRTCVSAR
jgi:hypothetical protein